ncbi:MAG: hypothetical protein IJI75_11795 [Solobacterium sp.]|nr:hypothetical protein [Solobacterium sp.]
MRLTTIMIIFMIFYMIYSNIGMGKKTVKSKKLNAVLQDMPDKDLIFQELNEMIAEETDPAFTAKYKVIKLWASIYHNENDLFLEVLDELDIDPLISDGKKNTVINYEDSFFYLLLAIPNRLFYAEEPELMKKFYEKLEPYHETLKSYLVYGLGMAAKKYYLNEDDLGREMYVKLDEGEYGEYRYNKQLIGIYKNIASSFMAGIALQQNDMELYEEQIPYLKSFSKGGLGSRWLKELGIELPEEAEEAEDEFDEESDEEESAEEEAETEKEDSK